MTDRGAGARFQWILEGPPLGEVAMEDVAKFLAGIVKVVELGCGHAAGRQVKQTGRREALIETARRIRLTSVASGSVVVYGSPATTPMPTQGAPSDFLLDAETVSELGLQIALDSARPRAKNGYADVAAAWVDVADELHVGDRFDRIRMRDLRRKGREAVIDLKRRDQLSRLARAATLPKVTTRTLRGYLFMANFERMVAQLRTPAGEIVDVSFGPEHADAIQAGLRHQPLVRGEVRYDPKTSRALSVEVRQIDMGEQLRAFDADFWADSTVSDLRAGRGRPGVTDVDAVRMAFTPAEEAELRAMIAHDR
jgi:hypothetical protein